MLTVAEVAKRLNVSQALVYGWVESGMLGHFRLGCRGKRGAIRVDEADLQTFLANQKREDKILGQPMPEVLELT
jgi:excisionase family DNA binding protein